MEKEPPKEQSSNDQEYFDAYEDLSVHQLMLQDRPRMEAYRKFIEDYAEDIRGKVVLDVGTGTGVLAMLAARAGAAKVFAVEASQVAQLARLLVTQNNLGHKVAVVQGRVEEVDLGEKVDVIVSEWMGFYLLHEAMLNSVLVARDKWLKPGGLILPTAGSLFLAPATVPPADLPGHSGGADAAGAAPDWSSFLGFDFSPLEQLLATRPKPPLVRITAPSELQAPAQRVAEFDFSSVTLPELSVVFARLTYRLEKEATIHGFCCWFDVSFVPRQSSKPAIVLSTSPFSAPTHWKQCIFLLPAPIIVKPTQPLNCNISFLSDETNPRHYNVSIEVDDEAEGAAALEEAEDMDPPDCDCAKCKLLRALVGEEDEEMHNQVHSILFTPNKTKSS